MGGRSHPDYVIPEKLKDVFFKSVPVPNLIKDYDVIGFELDSLANYSVEGITKMVVECHLKDLVVNFKYTAKITDFDCKKHLGMFLNNAIWDIKNNLVLKLAANKRVVRAMSGFKSLTAQEIEKVYGNPPIYGFVDLLKARNLESENPYWLL
jgi:hypothetical protein